MIRKKETPMMKKIIIPFCVVILVQAILMCAAILWGGTVQTMTNNTFDILNERVINRKNYLETEMVQRWSNIQSSVERIEAQLDEGMKKQSITSEMIVANSSQAADLLADASNNLIYMLRKSGVSGAFLILDGTGGQPGQAMSALYLRDYDPDSTPADNSDLLIERGPSALTKKLRIAMDVNWQPDISAEESHLNFIRKPLNAAVSYPNIEDTDLAYWATPYCLAGDDVQSIAYSMPLRDAGGRPYGVIGVEITLDYLKTLLPSKEVDSGGQGAYLLAVGNARTGNYTKILSQGAVYQQYFGDQATVSFSGGGERSNSYTIDAQQQRKGTVYGCVQSLQMYNSNTPFSSEEWVLAGVVPQSDMLHFIIRLEWTLGITLVLSMLLGLVIAFLVGRVVTRPVTTLASTVKKSDPHQPIRLEYTGIQEVDDLARAVERLSRDVADSASKLSQIFRMAKMPVGAFEWEEGSDRIYCMGELFELVGVPLQDTAYIETAEFNKILQAFDIHEEPELGDRTYRYPLVSSGRPTRWIRLHIVREGFRCLGVVTDVTQEVMEKRRLEYERDYDLLTDLLNRRAFYSNMTEKFAHPEKLGIGAMLMMDLDNLKYINDTYGHDCGDEYIRCAAEALKTFIPYQTIISRMSGDEFYVFLYGYQTEEAVRHMIEEIKGTIQNMTLLLPDRTQTKVRASVGVSWYPKDSENFEELIRFADFAMYTVKNSAKGEWNEFNMESYHRDSYLLSSKEQLNRLLEEGLIEYHFQPIADVRTGRVFAYEALMRSTLPTLRMPLEILTLARSQFKLHQLERLTWFKAMEAFDSNRDQIGEGRFLFINSIANQIFSDQDGAALEQRHPELLNRVVLELTEEEKLNEDFMIQKKERIGRWGARTALDDFGTGYNGEAALLTLRPDFVKIDMSIVRNIDADENRQKIFGNLVSYARGTGIRVIAEGVETAGEMETLIRMGVDYIQGYYLGRPMPQPEDIPEQVKEEILRIAAETDPSAKAE